MANTINGEHAFRTFTDVANKYAKSQNADGSKLSRSEIDSLKIMLDSMNSINKDQALNNLKHGNYEAFTELKAAK